MIPRIAGHRSADLLAATQRAKRAQLDYVQERTVSIPKQPTTDWSSSAVDLLDKSDFARAENVARREFELTGDRHAFLLMVSAAVRDGRFFDAKKDFDAHPEMLSEPSPLRRDLRELALKCYLETRDIDRAAELVDAILEAEGENPNVLLKKASILGLQAQYAEASRDTAASEPRLPATAGDSPASGRRVRTTSRFREGGGVSERRTSVSLRMTPGRRRNARVLGFGISVARNLLCACKGRTFLDLPPRWVQRELDFGWEEP